MNKSLFKDASDYEIAKLKFAIKRFKEYDEERKAFYKDKLQRLGKLESYIIELESGMMVNELRSKIENQKKEIQSLNKIIKAHNIESNKSEEDIDNIIKLDSLKRQNRELRKQIKSLKISLNKVVSELNKK